MKIRVYTWREMQTDLANEGMQECRLRRTHEPCVPTGQVNLPHGITLYSLLPTTYYLLSLPFFSSHPVKKASQNKKNAPSVTLFHIFLGSY